MRNRGFILFASLIALAAIGVLQSQRRSLSKTRAMLEARLPADLSAKPAQEKLPEPIKPPSPELLRLRNEVTLLRQELEMPVPPTRALKEKWTNEWAWVHSGPKPADYPGFVWLTNSANVGFSTPEAAFQSFNEAFHNQAKRRMDDTRMKELWDVPDDYDDPKARYSIHLGEGFSGGIGYRIVSQEQITSNEVALIVDYERADGSSYRSTKVLVGRNGRWRMKPAAVTRQSESPGGTQP